MTSPRLREVGGVDLIVAAASRGRMERVLLGGFASHLAHHAPCSVLFVHPEAGTEEEAPAVAASTAV